jgi:hypothetical protein
MCDYSLHAVDSRPARPSEVLIVTKFRGSCTRGFASPDDLNVAVCLRPGTEVAFEQDARRRAFLFQRKLAGRVARFRQVELESANTHHDALEFADGAIVKLNQLVTGQRLRIIQLPPGPKIAASIVSPSPKAEPIASST